MTARQSINQIFQTIFNVHNGSECGEKIDFFIRNMQMEVFPQIGEGNRRHFLEIYWITSQT